ncbi:hypothetical protein MTsPCn9_27180 [Croceitalea sp. MTPC9]|uniref:toxin-antitoxin system YwqK family antitoxin n=1 Tax=unclassified Croceitalea TaxID=2632280 RepID=UPI002B3B004F|nr:hypothetical protein MTsPCn6_23000 [Croceitalea sp. MTPC6]GMN17780.1 hypothetical protein MTsPCn9_27180 [Croceitalea sp. MTPC9]
MYRLASTKLFTSFTVLFFIIMLAPNMVNAQQDTIYYNTKWRLTVKDSASFYRSPITKVGDLYRVEDYYISGAIQMRAISKSEEKDLWQGKVTWYNEDGSIYQQGNYNDNRLDGDFITYLGDKKLTAKYENGRIKSGEQNTKSGSYQMYYKKVADTSITTFYQTEIQGIRYVTYATPSNYDVTTKYYGNDGKYLGKRKNIKGKGYDGIDVTYYRNPMRVKEIRYYTMGKYLNNSFYYPNGQIRQEFIQEPRFMTTYYDISGKKIGELTYQLDNYGLKPENGINYFFYYPKNGEQKNDMVQMKSYYKAGLLEKAESLYENQNLKQFTSYQKGVKQYVVSYNEQGEQIARMDYDGYRPFNGKEVQKDREIIYKEGKLVEEIKYYPKNKNIASKKTSLKEIFYDVEGSVLGELILEEDDYGYTKPMSGLRFYVDYEGDVSQIEKLENGRVVERTSFRKRKMSEDNTKTFKRIEIYGPDGYKKVKETVFYSNGKKQSEINYKEYKEISGTFYDYDGKVIGNYDYVKQDGKFYKFFYDSDQIQEIQTLKIGKQHKLKRYDYGKNVSYGQINPVLIEDIDIDCCAMFYDREGNLLGKTIFKNGKPWEGVLIDLNQRKKFTLKNGKKNGSYEKFDYNESILEEGEYLENEKQGVFKYYDYSNNLRKTEVYQNDKLDGEIIFYDGKGAILGKITYKNGMPMNGTLFKGIYAEVKSDQETYNNGKLVKSLRNDNNGRRITNYNDDNTIETIAYFKDTDKKRLSYSTLEGYVHGIVIRFNEKGEEQNRAVFEKGKLESGTVYLTSNDGNLSHTIFTKGDDKLTLSLVATTQKVVFKAEEDLLFNNFSLYTKKLGVYIDYIRPDQLY